MVSRAYSGTTHLLLLPLLLSQECQLLAVCSELLAGYSSSSPLGQFALWWHCTNTHNTSLLPRLLAKARLAWFTAACICLGCRKFSSTCNHTGGSAAAHAEHHVLKHRSSRVGMTR